MPTTNRAPTAASQPPPSAIVGGFRGRVPARLAVALTLLVLLSFAVPAQTPAAKPHAVKPNGAVPVTTVTLLVIRGVPGKIVVTTKPVREVHFNSRATDRSGGERAIGVLQSGTTITMEPPPGTTIPDGILRVEAPASFAVQVEAQGGSVLVDGFAGPVGIVGRDTVARAQGLTGPLDSEIQGGSLTLTDLGGPVKVRLSAATKLVASNLRGELDLDSQESTFRVHAVAGACRVRARGGSGELAGLAAGGDVRASESALRLSDGHGDLTITSDAAVVFSNMAASIRFDMDGGSVRGKGNQGSIEVRARRTDVNLEAITGALRIDGEGLKTKLARITGELSLDVTRGQVLLERIAGPVDAVIFAADARLLELQGPVRLDIDGGNAELAWTAIGRDRDSVVASRGGDVKVRLPAGAPCHVSAKTRSGRITSDAPSIKLPADATEVDATLGKGQGPRIEIEADGNIHLSIGAATPAAPS